MKVTTLPLLVLSLQRSPRRVCWTGHYQSILRPERREAQNGEHGQAAGSAVGGCRLRSQGPLGSVGSAFPVFLEVDREPYIKKHISVK